MCSKYVYLYKINAIHPKSKFVKGSDIVQRFLLNQYKGRKNTVTETSQKPLYYTTIIICNYSK